MSAKPVPFVNFSKYNEKVDKLVSSIDYDTLPKLNEKSLKDCRKDLQKCFDKGYDDLIKNPPETLTAFVKLCHEVFNKDVYAQIFSLWPPVLSTEKSEVQNLALYIVQLIHDSKKPHDALRYLSFAIVKPKWHGNKSTKNSIIKGVSVVKMKDVQYWAYVDTDKFIRIDLIENKQIKNHCNQEVVSFKPTKNGLKFKTSDETKIRCQLLNMGLSENWQNLNKTAYPLFLGSYINPVPKAVLAATYEAITANDQILYSILTNPSVIKVKDGADLMKDLFDIACYSQTVNQFFTLVVAHEFSQEDLTPQKVLRQNSHLTNLFKVLFSKYGSTYVKNFVIKLVDYILKVGDVGLNNVDKCKSGKAEKLLFTCLNYVLKSFPLIPPEIRHLGAILASQAALRFNTQEAVINTLSGFFCLRFLTAALSDPQQFVKDYSVTPEQLTTVLVPFASLIQKPLNFAPIEGNEKFVKEWNSRIQQSIYPRLKTFLLTIPQIDDMPAYVGPEPKHCKRALDHAIKGISESYNEFSSLYNSQLRDQGKTPPLGWEFGAYFMNFFKYEI
ncbi:hypothetical protein TRFO_33460 [Tritrichomonas foetus]|uniref:Ras-GAP domain-containing protein n=1 Tax=Tritrichomonas foetus TaxID=1144522 RepID=A0A1J4JRY4_9EUKA|nr:hypothetical protein TRFO_33460 [Tritrichomonas foetus]|eukprot:OHS99996.1 hypothetical protein TRFO_33460 [Tritrichomonas foetus]